MHVRSKDSLAGILAAPALPNVQISREIDAASATFFTIWIGVVGVIAYMFLPLVVGGLADEYGYSSEQLGFIGAAEAGGMGLANALAIFWMRRANWRSIILLSAFGMILANLGSAYVTDFNFMFVLRLLDGLAGGTLIAISVACQSDNKNADKVFGYFIALEMLASAVGFLILPSVVAGYGIKAIFLALAMLSVTGLACAFVHPRRGLNRNDQMNVEKRVGASLLISIIALTGALLFFMSQGGLWTFIERIAAASQLDPQWVGVALSVSSLCGIAGALGAGKAVALLGRSKVFIFVLVGEMICIALLLGTVGPIQYFAAVSLFIFFWSMGLPLLLTQFNNIDGSGHLVVLLYAMGKLGYTLGPAVMGLLVVGADFTSVLMFGAAVCALGLAVSIGLELYAGRTPGDNAV